MVLTVFIVILVLVVAWLVYSLFWGTPPSINLAVERLSVQMVLEDPELLTRIGVLDNTLLDFHSGRLTDASPRSDARRQQRDREGLALIRRYDPDQSGRFTKKLHGQEHLTYDLMNWYFEQNLRGHRFDYHWYANPVFMGPYPVNHVCGVQVDLISFLCNEHQIRGHRSLQRYLNRLYQIEWKLAGLQKSLQIRAEAGVIPPGFVLEKCLLQIESFFSEPVENNPLYTHIQEKLTGSGRFNHRVQERWLAQIKTAIERSVNPAYEGLAATLRTLSAQATEGDGVWRLPNGDAYYGFLLRQHTTTEMSPAEIHQVGLEEVRALTHSVQEILQELGLPTETPGLTIQSLQSDPQHRYQGSEAGEDVLQAERDIIIQDFQAILDQVNQHMGELFSFGSLKEIAVQRLPEFKEPDSPIAYAQPPSLDGRKPGTLWLNLREPENVYRWGMPTLAYHEGIPGHVYQMAQAQQTRGIPTFRRMYAFNAYTEGWALYAEYLGWELAQAAQETGALPGGLGDPLCNLGRLQALLWRAVRLVVDTGIHAMRWTRQDAINYMIEKTGLPERDVITEIERYIVMPGQACAYYLGYMALLSLRQKAEAILGDAFEIKAFHDVVLHHGGLPLPLLTQVVNDFIDQTAGLQASA